MRIDLNADLGEGFGVWDLGDDAGLLEVVTSANVACGFHAGDPAIMRRVCGSAVERRVAIGAQVGYRDLAGFGRRAIDIVPAELTDEVIYQIGALDGFARVAGDRVRYVKPHGALYHAAVASPGSAGAIVEAVRRYDPALPVVTLAGGELARLALEAGLAVVPEAFGDRAYTADGRLLSRRVPGAVLHDPREIAARVVRMVTAGTVSAVDGTTVPVTVESVCVHGDTPGALAIARAVRAALEAASVALAAFAAGP
ncbi:MAG: LamB/YcsF family protein [Pseudonocardiales bacterium]|nr:MAG: LamB/YcsF family protein [Pseudonocardiales bacterium]